MDAREIGDIGDAVLSFSEAKALATNNPLLMDKAEADAALARLVRAERAHQRNQDTLRRTIASHEREITRLTQLAADLDTAIARRQDTRGDAFTMTVEGSRYCKRADAGQHLLRRLVEEAASQLGYRQRQLRVGELGGFSLTATVTGPAELVHVSLAFDDAPATDMGFTRQDLAAADPAGLVSRLENRLAGLEAAKGKTLANIEHARSEIEHAAASLGKPFPQAAELTDARRRCREIEEQLQAAAAPASGQGQGAEPPPGQPTAGTPASAPGRGDDRRAEAAAGGTAHRRPPWPSAAERAVGPTPTRSISRRAEREPKSPIRPGSSPSGQRDGDVPYPAAGPFERGHDPLAGKPATVPEREAGQ